MSGAHFAMNVNTEVQQCSESRLRDYPQSSLLSQWQRVMANLFQLRTACDSESVNRFTNEVVAFIVLN